MSNVRYNKEEMRFMIIFLARCICCTPMDDRTAIIDSIVSRKISEELGIAPKTVKKYLNDMVNDGEVERKSRGVYVLPEKHSDDIDRYQYINWKMACKQWDSQYGHDDSLPPMPSFEQFRSRDGMMEVEPGLFINVNALAQAFNTTPEEIINDYAEKQP